MSRFGGRSPFAVLGLAWGSGTKPYGVGWLKGRSALFLPLLGQQAAWWGVVNPTALALGASLRLWRGPGGDKYL